MSALDDFKANFDPDGLLRDRDGSLHVVFGTKGGVRFPGKLDFQDGFCVKAELDGGGQWDESDMKRVHGIRFLLDLGDEHLHGIAVDQGHVFSLDAPTRTRTRNEFLLNLRVARSFFSNPKVESDDSQFNVTQAERSLTRAAIWLTPKSVDKFVAADFPDTSVSIRSQMESSIRAFRDVAEQVLSDEPATDDQFQEGREIFAQILSLFEPYLPMTKEARQVEEVLRTVRFPDWVVSWDVELGSDADGSPAVWVSVFADDRTIPEGQLGRASSELSSVISLAFDTNNIKRYSYIRMKTAHEYKVG